MNKIKLTDLKLKIFSEQDVSDYCLLNNIIINQLTDILGLKQFNSNIRIYK